MNTSIIVEGETDRIIIDAAFRAIKSRLPFTVVPAGGRSSAISLARSYLTLPSAYVALLLDADALDKGQVQDEQSGLEDSLAALAPTWQFGVFLAIPQIEACFFCDPNLTKDLFRTNLTPELLMRARFEPKFALMELLGAAGSPGNYARALSTLLGTGTSLDGLADCSPLKELRQFIESSPKAGRKPLIGHQ